MKPNDRISGADEFNRAHGLRPIASSRWYMTSNAWATCGWVVGAVAYVVMVFAYTPLQLHIAEGLFAVAAVCFVAGQT